MKRLWSILLLLVLIGCAAVPEPVTIPESAAPTANVVFPVEVTDSVDLPETAAPDGDPVTADDDLPVQDGDLTVPEAPESVLTEGALPAAWVSDGAAFGCDVIAYVGGFGLAFDLDGKSASECRLAVEEQATQDLPPYETHRVLLTVGSDVYCLGELRFNAENPNQKNLYGVPYEWVVMDSDLVDIDPADPNWALIAPKADGKDTVFNGESAGLIAGFDAAAHTVDVFPAKQKYLGGEEYEFLPESVSDTAVTLSVPEDAILSIMGEEYRMLVSRDRFFTLLEDGYIGFFCAEDEDLFVGVELGCENGSLRYLREIG